MVTVHGFKRYPLKEKSTVRRQINQHFAFKSEVTGQTFGTGIEKDGEKYTGRKIRTRRIGMPPIPAMQPEAWICMQGVLPGRSNRGQNGTEFPGYLLIGCCHDLLSLGPILLGPGHVKYRLCPERFNLCI